MGQKKNKGVFIIELAKPYKVLECDTDFLQMMNYSVDDLKKKVHILKNLVEQNDYEDFVASLEYQLDRSNYTSDRIFLINGKGNCLQMLVKGQAFTIKDGREVLKCTCLNVSTIETATLVTEQAYSDLEVFSQSVRCGLSKHICNNSLSLVWANDYFYTLFGYTKEEYESKFHNELIPLIYPEDLSLVVNSITNLLEDHEIDITFRIRHKLKKFRWVNLVAASVENDDKDDFPVANFVINDITNLKYAEMQAQLEAQKYEIIADISEEIPFEYEVRTDILTYAKKYENIFGRKSIYRHPQQSFVENNFVSKDTMDSFLGIFEAAKNGEPVHNTEYKLMNIKGEYEWHYSTFSLIKDENGNPFRAIGVVRNIHYMKKEQEALRAKAQTDSMTGLLNKATVEAYINEHMKEVQSGTKDVLMVVDIDDFKDVNDSYGHLLGDEVIMEIAKSLMRFTFNDGVVGRIGGDEFIVYMKNVLDPTFACEKAEKVAKSVLSKYPGGNGKPKVTLSIGIATTDIAVPYKALMEKADAAVYQAKINGKARYVLYDESLERGDYHNDRKNGNNFNSLVISNALDILCENINVSACINQALQYVGTALDIHKIVIWEYSKDCNFLEKSMEWKSSAYDGIDGNFCSNNAVAWEEVDSLTINGTFHSSNVGSIKLSNFSKGPFSDAEEFIQSKFKREDITIGFIGYISYAKDDRWSMEKIETLNVFTKILTGYMQRKSLEEDKQ
ncbi:MAG: diguanylate cyclase domain-containing protein [Lachnospiraceae bacterium]